MTLDSYGWTGRGAFADDFRIRIGPSFAMWRWLKTRAKWIWLPALEFGSGYRMEADCRGWWFGFGLCGWREPGEIAWFIHDGGYYRHLSTERLIDRGVL